MTSTDDDTGAPFGPGSHASTEPAGGLGPTGFDPSREQKPDGLQELLDDTRADYLRAALAAKS